MSEKPRVPSYRLHRQSGQAIVTLTDAATGRRRVLEQVGIAGALVAYLSDRNGKGDKDKAPPLAPEKFEVLVTCHNEGHQREVYDRLTGEGLRRRVLTF